MRDEAATLQSKVAESFDPPFSHPDLVALGRFYALSPVFLRPTTGDPPPPRKLTPAEQAEADQLKQNPAVTRYIQGIGPAINSLQGDVGRIMTAALQKNCPNLQTQQPAGPAPP
jgi:hypothetical protein